MLPAPYRLRRSAEITAVRKLGQRWHHSLATLYVLANQQDTSRFAFVAGRRVGNAVKRNRSKRILREAIRHSLPQITPGWDCLIIARDSTAQASYQDVLAATYQLLQRAHILQPSPNKGVVGL